MTCTNICDLFDRLDKIFLYFNRLSSFGFCPQFPPPTINIVKYKTIGVSLLSLAAFSASAQAAIVTVPTGLGPGAQYRLVFVTSTTTTATDTTAAYYNNFVNNLAQSVPELQALGVMWTVMGNLNGANPWQNTGTEGSDVIPIYRMDDTVFAANYTALKAAPTVSVSLNELGIPVINSPQEVGRVWTGMGEASSIPQISSYIGSGGAGGNTQAARPDNLWYTWGWYGVANTTQQHLYAMSGVITVAAIPEPSAALLGGLGMLCLLRRRRSA